MVCTSPCDCLSPSLGWGILFSFSVWFPVVTPDLEKCLVHTHTHTHTHTLTQLTPVGPHSSNQMTGRSRGFIFTHSCFCLCHCDLGPRLPLTSLVAFCVIKRSQGSGVCLCLFPLHVLPCVLPYLYSPHCCWVSAFLCAIRAD